MVGALLNLARVRPRSRANGPGWRAAVWVQGCSIRCSGCFNPGMQGHVAQRLLDPEALADGLWRPDIEGVSILGGEPFEQAAACTRLAQRARARGLSVMVYSGYTHRFLRDSGDPVVQALLAASDLLLAGPFQAARATDGRGWFGSDNQELVFLTDRYDEGIRAQWDEAPVVEAWCDGGVLDWTGIPAVAP
jgi:anaerobic ribonucleoside-triphosphate reductase activating protein